MFCRPVILRLLNYRNYSGDLRAANTFKGHMLAGTGLSHA